MSTNSRWSSLKVVLSDCNVPGEGEHKIAQWIRTHKHAHNQIHCMYGLDADLFMLSLGTHCPNFLLLREDQYTELTDDIIFHVVNIGKLRAQLLEKWGTPEDSLNKFVDDFIFCCFLVGNDFLHSLPSCHTLDKAIPFLLKHRKEQLTNNKIVLTQNLLKFFSRIAKMERVGLETQLRTQHRFKNNTLKSCLFENKKTIDYMKYRDLYYKKANISCSETICRDYLQGLQWVQWYYHDSPKNWRWFYPHHYSPLLRDLVLFLSNTPNFESITKKVVPPLLPFQQLVCVIPPDHSHLLPKNWIKVYSVHAKYFPTEFKIDYEGKQNEWEGVALLPFLNVDEILQACPKFDKSVKNSVTKELVYTNSLETKYTYRSEFGVVKNCVTKISNKK